MTTSSVAPLPNPRASLDLAVNLGLLVLLASLWGASYSFIKVGIETIPPITLIAGRTAIAGMVLLMVMRGLGLRMPRDARSWRSFMVQACLNSVLPFTAIAWAEQTVDASLATILNSTSPIFIFLLAMALRLEGERTWGKFLGVAFGFAGIVLVIGADALQGLTRELVSQLVIVGATVCYAGAAVFGRRFSGMHAIVPAAGSMIAGGAVLIPASLVIDRPWTLSVSTDSALALLGLSVLSTALAFVIYFRLLKTLGSVGTAAQAYLRVPIGVALGALVLGETLPLTAWAGMACVIAGVAAMTLPGRRGGRLRPPEPSVTDEAIAGDPGTARRHHRRVIPQRRNRPMFDGIPDPRGLDAAPWVLRRRPWHARLAAWLRRCGEKARQRRALARLDARLLADVGLTRAEATRECAKPFWR